MQNMKLSSFRFMSFNVCTLTSQNLVNYRKIWYNFNSNNFFKRANNKNNLFSLGHCYYIEPILFFSSYFFKVWPKSIYDDLCIKGSNFYSIMQYYIKNIAFLRGFCCFRYVGWPKYAKSLVKQKIHKQQKQ